MLRGIRSGVDPGAADQDDRITWTRNHFGVVGELTPTNSHIIFDLSGGFNVPDLLNASGQHRSMNVAVRLLASLGLPFLEMARESFDATTPFESRRDTLQALIDLLDNDDGYSPKDTDDLRQRINAPEDLDVVVVLLRLLACLKNSSQDRFKSVVDQVRECPRRNCRPHDGANYQRLNYVYTKREVSIYMWSTPDADYNERHDDYQRARIADVDGHSRCSFVSTFRNLGYARGGTMDYCANPQCDVDNNNPARCRVKERLTMAKPVGGLPRWQFIKCNVEVPNPYEPYDHDDNRANFDALKVTPHATLDLHGFYESTPAGPPTWNTDHRKSYKLRGYVLLSSRTYGHLAWRTSFTVGNTTLYLHCHDKNVYFISEEEYSKSDQKILLLVYETDSQPPSPTASTSSGGTSDPSQRNPNVGSRGCWI